MKNKTLILVLAIPLMMSSCLVSTYHYTTGNPIGTKEGFVKYKNFMKAESGIGAAAKKGGITKIGSVDCYYYSFGKVKVRVTGE